MSSFSERRPPRRKTTGVAVVLALAILCAGSATLVAQQSLDTSNRIPGAAPSRIRHDDEFVQFEREVDIDMSELGKAIVYPDSAWKTNMSGRVILRCLVGRSGTIDSVVVHSATHPIFIAPSVTAIRSLRGKPAILDGAPVPSWLSIPIIYNLE